MTAKPGKLYLHVFDWPKGEITLYGLNSKVPRRSAAQRNVPLKLSASIEKPLNIGVLKIQLPAAAPDAK